MNSNGHYMERTIEMAISGDTFRSNAIASLTQFLRAVGTIKRSEEITDVKINWASVINAETIPLEITFKEVNGKPEKEVYVKQLNGEGLQKRV